MNMFQALFAWILGLALIAAFFRSADFDGPSLTGTIVTGLGMIVHAPIVGAVPHACLAQRRAVSD